MSSNVPPVSKLHFGLAVEAKAALWYLERTPGARLVGKSFRWKGGEIDLIFEEPVQLPFARVAHERGDHADRVRTAVELVFVEVRARLPGSWVSGVDSVSFPKQRRLRQGIELYLSRYRGKARSTRLDLVAWDGERWEHLKNALQD